MRLKSFSSIVLFSALLIIIITSVNRVSANPNASFGYLIVAHPSVNEKELSTRELAKIYALQMKNWDDGKKIKAFTYKVDSSEFESFCTNDLRIQPYQLQRVWNRMIFTGVGSPPLHVKDANEMLSKIRLTQGAIGYLPANIKHDLAGLKVIKVER